jgi:hypothetical protein
MCALGTLTASCASTPPAASNSPVMAAKAPEKPHRSSIEFERVKQSGRTFLIQNSTWSDGSKARTLAAVWLEESTPVEIVVVDDVVLEQKLLAQKKPPFDLDLLPNLASLTIRNTGYFVNAESFLNPLQADKNIPSCEKSEIRGIARLPEQKSAAVVCLQFEAMKAR